MKKCDNFLKLLLFFLLFNYCYQDQNNSYSFVEDSFFNEPNYFEWKVNHGDIYLNRFVDNDEIDKSNVNELYLKWQIDLDQHLHQVQSSAVIYQNLIISPTANNKLIAISIESGEIVWTYESQKNSIVKRGIVTTSNYIFTNEENSIVCLNAMNGEICNDFGEDGRVNFEYQSRINPIVHENRLIVLTMKPSVISINLITGEIEWEKNLNKKDSPELIYAPWGGASFDPIREVIYTTTGNPKPTFNGVNRPGDNEYANSVIAINANTGEIQWSFQEIKHDIWNLDIAAGPLLTTIKDKESNSNIEVVVAATKAGNLFILDRESGRNIHPTNYVSVSSSKRKGENTAEKQIFQTFPEPFSKQNFDTEDITNISKERYDYVFNQIVNENFGYLVPHEKDKKSIYFGIHGGAQWPGASINPFTNEIYIASSHIPWILEFYEDDSSFDVLEYQQLLDNYGYPGSKPPWGSLSSYDLNTGNKLWSIPFGEYDELSSMGIDITGTENFGGPTSTSGDVIFITGTRDKKLYAFNSKNGEKLWEHKMPHHGSAPPTVFSYEDKQYIFIQSSGGGKLSQFDPLDKSTEGNSFLLFTLP